MHIHINTNVVTHTHTHTHAYTLHTYRDTIAYKSIAVLCPVTTKPENLGIKSP